MMGDFSSIAQLFRASKLRVRGTDNDLASIMDEVKREFPAIAKHDFILTRGEGPGYAETYPYFERHNPVPGKNVIELRPSSASWSRDEIKSMVAGEMLHILGGTDPVTGRPIDPGFRAFKDRFVNSLTPDQLTFERFQYRSGNQLGGVEVRDFDQWFETSLADAYLRGYLFPDRNDEWRKQDMYTTQQRDILNEAGRFLRGR